MEWFELFEYLDTLDSKINLGIFVYAKIMYK